MEVTLHPAMGYYLSHLNNPAEDVSRNIHPDENYARELFELFTLGKGPESKYTEDDVKAAAKVLTGWSINWSGAQPAP